MGTLLLLESPIATLEMVLLSSVEVEVVVVIRIHGGRGGSVVVVVVVDTENVIMKRNLGITLFTVFRNDRKSKKTFIQKVS